MKKKGTGGFDTGEEEKEKEFWSSSQADADEELWEFRELSSMDTSKVPLGVQLEKKALKELDFRTFDLAEFEVILDYLQTNRDARLLDQQRSAAASLGVNHKALFLEFRRELSRLREVFVRFDANASTRGRLDENEAWVALTALGFVPRSREQKLVFLRFLVEACMSGEGITGPGQQTTRGMPRQISPGGGMLRQISGDSASRPTRRLSAEVTPIEEGTPLEESGSPRDGAQDPGATLLNNRGGQRRLSVAALLDPEDPDMRLGSVGFEDFLALMSRLRSWLQLSTRDELQALFDRCIRRRGGVRHDSGNVLGIPEICMALEDLGMAPTCAREQKQISIFLEDTNEWGFEPLTMDFETFVRFIRRVREWRASIERVKERSIAVNDMKFAERAVTGHRIAFDVFDTHSRGELDITGIRKIFLKLKFNISSEQLRTNFARVDRRQCGSVRFLEYLQLVHTFEAMSQSQLLMNKSDTAAEDMKLIPEGLTGREARELQKKMTQIVDEALDDTIPLLANAPAFHLIPEIEEKEDPSKTRQDEPPRSGQPSPTRAPTAPPTPKFSSKASPL